MVFGYTCSTYLYNILYGATSIHNKMIDSSSASNGLSGPVDKVFALPHESAMVRIFLRSFIFYFHNINVTSLTIQFDTHGNIEIIFLVSRSEDTYFYYQLILFTYLTTD